MASHHGCGLLEIPQIGKGPLGFSRIQQVRDGLELAAEFMGGGALGPVALLQGQEALGLNLHLLMHQVQLLLLLGALFHGVEQIQYRNIGRNQDGTEDKAIDGQVVPCLEGHKNEQQQCEAESREENGQKKPA